MKIRRMNGPGRRSTYGREVGRVYILASHGCIFSMVSIRSGVGVDTYNETGCVMVI